jgi:hypothetical protein
LRKSPLHRGDRVVPDWSAELDQRARLHIHAEWLAT